MGDYVPGTMWKENLRRRNEEKQNEAMLQATLIREEGQRQRTLEARQFEVTTKVFDSFTKAMDDAPPTMKKIMRERLGGVLKELGTRNPFMARALQARYPKEFRKMKIDAYLETSPPPNKTFGGTVPSDNYAAYAQDIVNKKVYNKRMAKAIDDRDIDITEFHQLDEKIGMLVGNDGKFQLVNMEMMNEDPKIKELREKRNISLLELQLRGGDYDEGTIKVLGTGSDGQPYETVQQVTKNVFDGKMRLDQMYSTKKVNKIVHGQAPVPEGRAMTLISHLAAQEPPDSDKSPTEAVLYDDIIDMGEEYYKLFKKAKSDPEKAQVMGAFEAQVEKKLQQLSPEHVFVISPGAKGKKFEEGGTFFKDFRIGKTATIKPVYGKRTQFLSSDGKPVNVIVDEANNLGYDSEGNIIQGQTVEALRNFVGSKTLDQLVKGE